MHFLLQVLLGYAKLQMFCRQKLVVLHSAFIWWQLNIHYFNPLISLCLRLLDSGSSSVCVCCVFWVVAATLCSEETHAKLPFIIHFDKTTNTGWLSCSAKNATWKPTKSSLPPNIDCIIYVMFCNTLYNVRKACSVPLSKSWTIIFAHNLWRSEHILDRQDKGFLENFWKLGTFQQKSPAQALCCGTHIFMGGSAATGGGRASNSIRQKIV